MGYFLDDSGNFENLVKIWTRRPPNYHQNASKNTRKIMESSWKHIIYVNMGHHKFRKFLNSGPPKHLFFLILFWRPAPPPKKKKISLSKRFQRIFRWWILGILGQSYFWNYWNISKSYWIKHIFQMVTYHLSKNLSPRTFLVFMENHGFENFSPHTFLVFMENPLFEL